MFAKFFFLWFHLKESISTPFEITRKVTLLNPFFFSFAFSNSKYIVHIPDARSQMTSQWLLEIGELMWTFSIIAKKKFARSNPLKIDDGCRNNCSVPHQQNKLKVPVAKFSNKSSLYSLVLHISFSTIMVTIICWYCGSYIDLLQKVISFTFFFVSRIEIKTIVFKLNIISFKIRCHDDS